MNRIFPLFALAAAPIPAQPVTPPNPTEQSFIANQASQMIQLRAATVGNPLPAIQMSPHQLFLATGLLLNNSGSVTVAAANAYTDSLALARALTIDVNLNMDLFVNNSAASSALSLYDQAFQHVIADGLTIKLNMSVNSSGGSGSVTQQFTADACNASMGGVVGCNTSTGACSVSHPCFASWSQFQTYFFKSGGPVDTLINRWGGTTAGQGMSTSLIALNALHEYLSLSCPVLNPNWTSSNQCTGANILAFGNAFVTLIRAYSSGTCTNCPTSAAAPMDLSTTFLAGADAVLYNSNGSCSGTTCACGATSTLSSCGIDVYANPTNTPFTFYTTTLATFFNFGVLLPTGRWYVEEWVPPNWVPNNNPQPEALSYRAGANIDWNRTKTDQEAVKAFTLFIAAKGAWRFGLFDAYKLFWNVVQPSCTNGTAGGGTLPASCGNPTANCGNAPNAGTGYYQCFGDITTENPFLSYITTQMNTVGAGVTPLGQLWGGIANGAFTSGSF